MAENDWVFWTFTVCEEEFKRKEEDRFLSKEDLFEILNDDCNTLDEKERESIIGYPSRPLFKDIGNRMREWMDTGVCSSENLPTYHMLNERDYHIIREEKIREITPKLKSMESLFPFWSHDERLYNYREILKRLGKRGILDILGMRKMYGSQDIFPPPRKQLLETFTALHAPGTSSILTVGGRALTKHSHRDHSSSWWGVCTGSEQKKIDHALAKMSNILDNATWLNVHNLPGELPTIEARQENGYGVRWTIDGGEFRGFLEPQMVDGHEVGWKH